MKISEINQKVIQLVSEQVAIPVNEITENKSLIGDLGFDSLDIVELVIAVEDELKMSIADEEISDSDGGYKFTSVGEFIAIVLKAYELSFPGKAVA